MLTGTLSLIGASVFFLLLLGSSGGPFEAEADAAFRLGAMTISCAPACSPCDKPGSVEYIQIAWHPAHGLHPASTLVVICLIIAIYLWHQGNTLRQFPVEQRGTCLRRNA